MNLYWCFITLPFWDDPYTFHIGILYHWYYFSLFLSPFYPHLFLYFALQLRIRFFLFMQNRFQLLQWYDQYIISWLVFWIQIIRSDELVIRSIVISSYYGGWLFFFLNPNPKKTNESLRIIWIQKNQSRYDILVISL